MKKPHTMNSFPVAWPPEVFIARHKILKKSLINDTNINPNQCKIQQHKNAIEYSKEYNHKFNQIHTKNLKNQSHVSVSYPSQRGSLG